MHTTNGDPIWQAIRAEVEEDARNEPVLMNFLYGCVLNHDSLEDALSFMLATKLGSTTIPAILLRDLVDEALRNDAYTREALRADLQAVMDRDPACNRLSVPLLYFKGYHAIQSYRVAHYFWNQKRQTLALFLQTRIAQVLAVDIHPAARVGKGLLMDHATGVVIGETAVVGDNVSILHEVTLGGTGKQSGDRHPKVRDGVLLSAGAKLLGNIVIGEGAKVGAGSIVLYDVPAHTTVVGVPAKAVGPVRTTAPAMDMDHTLDIGGGI